MRKVAAILLLLILIFNFVGYRFVFNYFEYKAVASLEQKINNAIFNENELQEISIPLNMPYYSDTKLENVSGEIELNGNHYQYVKRKVENNILHIWCLINSEKNTLKILKTDVAKSNTDNASGEKQKHSFSIKIFQAEFVEVAAIGIATHELITTDNPYVVRNNNCFSLFNPSQTGKPPEFEA